MKQAALNYVFNRRSDPLWSQPGKKFLQMYFCIHEKLVPSNQPSLIYGLLLYGYLLSKNWQLSFNSLPLGLRFGSWFLHSLNHLRENSVEDIRM